MHITYIYIYIYTYTCAHSTSSSPFAALAVEASLFKDSISMLRLLSDEVSWKCARARECLCVCVNVCMCVNVCAYIFIYIYMCVCVRGRESVHLRVCAHKIVCKYVHSWQSISVCVNACVSARVWIYMCMHVCTYVCPYVCMYVWIYMCMHVCTHVWICMCVIVCTHAQWLIISPRSHTCVVWYRAASTDSLRVFSSPYLTVDTPMSRLREPNMRAWVCGECICIRMCSYIRIHT
jgi:hypothetical protein